MTVARIQSWIIQTIKQAGLPAIVLFTFHVIASRGFHAYDHFPLLDIPMHILGGVVIAYFFHGASITASRRGIIGPFHRVTHIVLVFALTCAATVFWDRSAFRSTTAPGNAIVFPG